MHLRKEGCVCAAVIVIDSGVCLLPKNLERVAVDS